MAANKADRSGFESREFERIADLKGERHFGTESRYEGVPFGRYRASRYASTNRPTTERPCMPR